MKQLLQTEYLIDVCVVSRGSMYVVTRKRKNKHTWVTTWSSYISEFSEAVLSTCHGHLTHRSINYASSGIKEYVYQRFELLIYFSSSQQS